ncbi:hypothetical protein CDHC01_1776 [Corynebacterium diphtheriae HC01]|nr:hypothetical protein CD31A_1864 [Corynebacterium diphtheriae 31A]AEX44830.1 hypothetical protein CD241_1773 [Corynebacterium diphtheriae 241]AEX75020.1 hypothetical protein CDHC01_1776 [Corynebacterium diphtheriae HC01]AEX81744.1 hypothetical protein CDHC04_1753 [Corynebacterium diphtheriae HC04]
MTFDTLYGRWFGLAMFIGDWFPFAGKRGISHHI